MALTATAQSALPREPTWDEVIVPALRKRLRDESTVLAKRISAASITSTEDLQSQYYNPRPGTSTSANSQSSKPSAIPRPSLQSSRTAESSAGVYAGAHPPSIQRPRALSQPYRFEPPPSADSPPLTSDTRPISPVNPPKGTRIPVSRTRTGSTSSQTHSPLNGLTGRVNGTSGYSRHNGEPSESQLWPVEEKMHSSSQTSRSTVRIPRHKASDIFQEPVPFLPNSLSSQSQLDYYGRRTPERMSSDSEEHPFEHWYRGDVARNGGVGELRVARRQEMLDIANYGHTLRKASDKYPHNGQSTRSRSNSRGRDTVNGRSRARHRADSVGARESIYFDEDEMQAEAAVMDEQPLTDLEDDGYEDEDHLDDYYSQAVQPHPNGSISSPSLDRSDTPTSRHTHNTSRSRIPQPTSRSRTTTPTPAKPSRSASESGITGPSSPSISPQVSRSASSQSKPQGLPPSAMSAPSTPNAKRRAKSPANTAPASASKKQKGKAPPSAMPRQTGSKNEQNRRSIGQYPLPDGDADAIPTWTQPVPANGNWDEVVLPVVARKKGLQGQYETADGSPKPKEPEPVVIEPAPGTFGFDPTRYRKRYSTNPEQIPMDEFGQMPNSSPIQETSLTVPVPDTTSQPTTPIPPRSPQSYDRSNRVASPPPFAHYAGSTAGPGTIPDVAPPHSKEQQQMHADDDASSAGCCKCVIM